MTRGHSGGVARNSVWDRFARRQQRVVEDAAGRYRDEVDSREQHHRARQQWLTDHRDRSVSDGQTKYLVVRLRPRHRSMRDSTPNLLGSVLHGLRQSLGDLTRTVSAHRGQWSVAVVARPRKVLHTETGLSEAAAIKRADTLADMINHGAAPWAE